MLWLRIVPALTQDIDLGKLNTIKRHRNQCRRGSEYDAPNEQGLNIEMAVRCAGNEVKGVGFKIVLVFIGSVGDLVANGGKTAEQVYSGSLVGWWGILQPGKGGLKLEKVG